MPTFTELLTASDAELVKVFYRVKSNPDEDFIVRINKIAAQLELNHSQLVCALGFNRHIRDLEDIYSTLGFRNYKLLSYRCNELYSTDTYNQLPIDNILDIYSERLEDQQILDSLRDMLGPRLEHVETEIGKHDDPAHIISYRMEVHSIYKSGLVGEDFANMRLALDNGQYRLMSDEVIVMVDAGLYPASNLFFKDMLSVDEKRCLIENKYIDDNMVKNRIQNTAISAEERDMLEDFI